MYFLWLVFNTNVKWGKRFVVFVECACNCQIKMYKVSNLSNFSPRLCLIPSICLPCPFLSVKVSFFQPAVFLIFFFLFFPPRVLDGKTEMLEFDFTLAPHLCVFVWVVASASTRAWISRAVNMRLILLLQLRVAERSAMFNCLQFGLPASDKSKRLCQVSLTACMHLRETGQVLCRVYLAFISLFPQFLSAFEANAGMFFKRCHSY